MTEINIDDDKWQTLIADLGEDARELATDFCADMRANLLTMQQALQMGDLDTLGRVAHSSKSSGAIFGARQLSLSCLQLEQRARQNGPDLDESLEAVRSAFQAVEKEIGQRLQAGR